MDVLLDANAIVSAGLGGPAFRSLYDYLERTNSALLLHEVVLEELLARKRRDVQDLTRNIDKVYKVLQRLDPGNSAAVPRVDEEQLVSNERSRLMSAAKRVEIVSNSPGDLAELVRRLANRIPPASSGGEEARDVLVWLTTSRLASARPLALITNDNLFYEGSSLHPTLASELGSIANFSIFRDLNGFLAAHHRRVADVTAAWVAGALEHVLVHTAIEHAVDDLSDYLRDRVDDLGKPTGDVSFLQLVQSEVKSFNVSDMPAGELYVGASVWVELEIQVGYYPRQRGGWHSSYEASANTTTVYPCLLMQVQMEVRDGDVVRAAVSEVESG